MKINIKTKSQNNLWQDNEKDIFELEHCELEPATKESSNVEKSLSSMCFRI